jgi:hypothetical protein
METLYGMILLLTGGVIIYYLNKQVKSKQEKGKLQQVKKQLQQQYQQEKKNCDVYIEENFEIAYAETFLSAQLTLEADRIPICRKCGNNKMQLWNVGPFEMDYRCTVCKKKYSGNTYIGSEKVNELYTNLNNLYLLIEKIFSIKRKGLTQEWNELISLIEFDYFKLRAGTPYVRAIYFYTNGEIASPTKSDRTIPQQIKDLVWQRDNGRCTQCGTNENLEYDHIIPHSKGGANTYRNIQLLCSNCNRTKSSNIG